jgi:hypothetical protein
MSPKFISQSFIVTGSATLIFGMVAGTSIPTNAETSNATDQASNNGSFIVAQTPGMERRQDRRGTRQDCRGENGLVGADKRNCKQEGRQN